jgi:hypothetical protein
MKFLVWLNPRRLLALWVVGIILDGALVAVVSVVMFGRPQHQDDHPLLGFDWTAVDSQAPLLPADRDSLEALALVLLRDVFLQDSLSLPSRHEDAFVEDSLESLPDRAQSKRTPEERRTFLWDTWEVPETLSAAQQDSLGVLLDSLKMSLSPIAESIGNGFVQFYRQLAIVAAILVLPPVALFTLTIVWLVWRRRHKAIEAASAA